MLSQFTRALIFLFAAIAASAADVAPATPGQVGERVFRELASYYEKERAGEPDRMPPYAAAIADLSDADPEKSAAASEYLVALLCQAQADETNDRAGYESGESVARIFRKQVSVELGEKASGPSALRVLQWLLDSERTPECLAAAVKILPNTRGPEAEKVISDLLIGPHPCAQVTLTAIQEAGRRNLIGCAKRVSELRGSYRKNIRDAAEAASKLLGVTTSIAFDSAEAFTPWLLEQLAIIRRMIPASVAVDAKWCVFVDPESGEPLRNWLDGMGAPIAVAGFVIGEDATDLIVVDWFGQKQRASKALAKNTERPFSEVVSSILEIQADKEKAQKEMPSYWFENRAVRLPTLLMAAWSIERGDRKSAAALLFPAIEKLPDDRCLVEIARKGLAWRVHNAMVRDFMDPRDYAAALELAKALSRPEYERSDYYDIAREVVSQFQKRGDDFKTFCLPTPAEWGRMKASMSRDAQVAYLAPRLRLLICGGYEDLDYREQQFAVAGGNVEVINPFIELSGMRLDPKELKTLIPFVASDDFILGASTGKWTGLSSLYPIRSVVAELFFDVTREDLVRWGDYEEMNDAARRAHIEKLTEWCRTNAHRSNAEILLAHLAKTDRSFLEEAKEAVERKLPGVTEILLRRMPEFTENKAEIAECIVRSKELPPIKCAREWLRDPDPRVRACGAMVLVRSGGKEKAEGYKVLRKLFSEADSFFIHSNAVETLLELREEKATALACLITKFHGKDPRRWGKQMLRLIQTGRPEILDYWLRALDDRTRVDERYEGENGLKRIVPVTRGEYAAKGLARLRKNWDFYDHEAEMRDAINEPLKMWVKEQFALIHEGKPTEFLDLSAREAGDGSMLE